MQEIRKMQMHQRRLATAAMLCLGVIPAVACALFGQNSQNRDDARTNQDASAQDRDSRQDRSTANSPEESDTVTLPAGYVIPVRLADKVNSNHDKAGDLFTGTVDPSVLVHDQVVIPRGTEAHIRMAEAKKGGHVHGKAKVRLELVSLIMNGERLGVDTNAPKKEKRSGSAKASAEAKKGPQGAGVMAGNPGAVAGPVIAAFAAAKVEVKPGSRIEFTLESPFTFEPPPPNSARQQEN
jgi:hypothetical protein